MSSSSRVAIAALGMSQRRRLIVASALGITAAIALGFVAPWQIAALSGWDVAAISIVGSSAIFILTLDGEATRRAAHRQDLSTAGDDLIIVIGSVVSLVGVVLTLMAANHQQGGLKAIMIAVAIATVVMSWALVHTLFTLRYARLYYDEPEGGIDFCEDSAPDYRDFAYLAFTIGMTYQVSDTDIGRKTIRRTITRHALLGYLFGTVIIGVTINVVGGLIK